MTEQMMRLEKTLMRAAKKKMISDDYRPTKDEPFMSERQREYFRKKLIEWRDEIMRATRRRSSTCRTKASIRTSPIERPRRRTARSSFAPATASAS